MSVCKKFPEDRRKIFLEINLLRIIFQDSREMTLLLIRKNSVLKYYLYKPLNKKIITFLILKRSLQIHFKIQRKTMPLPS